VLSPSYYKCVTLQIYVKRSSHLYIFVSLNIRMNLPKQIRVPTAIRYNSMVYCRMCF